MSATVNLKYVRFVKRISSGGSLSKYGYIGMMQQNGDALKSAAWVAASITPDAVTLTTNKLTKTDGTYNAESGAWTTKPTYTAYSGAEYDCFNQAGDAVAQDATMCGYAGCVAYRFKLPTSETANALQSVALAVQRDRYLRAGVRVSMALSDSDAPSDDWTVVRGEATGCVRSQSTAPAEGVVGVASFGLLGQPDVPYLTKSRAADATATFDTATAFAAAASYKYLYVYLTLEDPAGYWNLYKADEARQYYIEGSAMLVADGCSFTFASEPAATDSNALLKICDSSYASGLVINPPLPYEDYQYVQGCDVVISTQSDLVGLIDCYSAFYADALERIVSTNPSTVAFGEDSPSAGFNVSCRRFVNRTLPNTIVGDIGKTAFIARRKYLIPFSTPLGCRNMQLRFEWGSSNDLTSPSPPYLQYNVWILPGSKTLDYSQSVLMKHELWTAETDSVGPWRLVATWKGGWCDESGEKVVDLPSWVSNGPNTLLLTTFLPLDFFTQDSQGEMLSYGYMTGVRNSYLATEYGADMLTYGGLFYGGWNPTIKLIGDLANPVETGE